MQKSNSVKLGWRREKNESGRGRIWIKITSSAEETWRAAEGHSGVDDKRDRRNGEEIFEVVGREFGEDDFAMKVKG